MPSTYADLEGKKKNIKLYFERENISFQVLVVEIKASRFCQSKVKHEQ